MMQSLGLRWFSGVILYSYAMFCMAAPAERAGVRTFVATSGNNVTHTQHDNGLSRFISAAPGRPLPNATPFRRAEDRAHSFLNSNRDLFVEPTAALELSTSRVMENDEVAISHVRLQQRFNGVEVYGAEAVVHLTDLGVTAVSSNLVSVPADMNTLPSIASDVALASAQDLVLKVYGPVPTQFTTPTLQIFDRELMLGKTGALVLTWYVEASGAALRERIWINAHSGEVVLNFSQITTARNRRTYDANNTTRIPTTPARIEAQAATGNIDVDMAHDFAGDFYNYFFTEHGRDSFDGAGIAIDSVVRVCEPATCPTPMKNAYWDGVKIALGEGFAVDDVVGHELSHAVIEKTANLLYQNEPGALNESYADIFGEGIDLWNGKGNDAANVRWLIGEEVPGKIGVGIRDMMNPAKFTDPARGKDPLYRCDSPDNGGVHTNSGVPNHAYALMVDGGIFNGYTITGIGLTKAAKIQYRALDTYLSIASGFIDNYDALLQSCTDLIGTSGITAGDCAQVKSALLAVEMNVIPCPTTTFNFPSALMTTEGGGTASFSVALTKTPAATANVTLTMVSSNPSEGKVTPASITFNATNWSVPRTITLTGVDDALADGDIPYSITATSISTDVRFDQVIIPQVKAVNLDNDTVAGIAVTPTSGLTTTESGGKTSYSVALTSPPTSDVTLNLLSDNLKEGTLLPPSIIFTPANWNIPRTITLTGVDDNVVDGNVPYHVTATISSLDVKYSALTAPVVNITNLDNDTAAITLNAASGLTTSESGGMASYSVQLTSQPRADAILTMASDNSSEGSVTPASVVFTASNWNVARTITVTGVDDKVVDGNVAYRVTTSINSADVKYSALTVPPVNVTNLDNDVAGITVTPAFGLMTSETGDSTTFTVRLTSQPTANVVIGLASGTVSEGTVAPASLTFSAANWDTTQTVTVKGIDDAVADGNVAYSIITAPAVSADANYSGRNAADVSVTNSDNDQANILVNSTVALVTSEAGATATFSLVLTTPPVAAVTVAIRSSNTNEGNVDRTQIVFTSANWNQPQSVIVTGVDDALLDGDVAYAITTDAAVSSDAKYNGINTPDVPVLNRDNDAASIIVTAAANLATTESQGTAQYSVLLSHQPSATVSIAVTSSNPNEGTVSPQTLTFTTSTWNKAQTVIITGVDDALVDGEISYKINLDPSASLDSKFQVLAVQTLDVINRDNDVPPAAQNGAANGLIVKANSTLTTTESGGAATFTIQLARLPAASVKIPLRSSNAKEGLVKPSSLTFDATNWDIPQLVTVTGVDDKDNDGNVAYKVLISVPSTSDQSFASTQPREITVINSDNEEKVSTGAFGPLFLLVLFGFRIAVRNKKSPFFHVQRRRLLAHICRT